MGVVVYSSKNCGVRGKRNLYRPMVFLSIAAGTAVVERPNDEKGFV